MTIETAKRKLKLFSTGITYPDALVSSNLEELRLAARVFIKYICKDKIGHNIAYEKKDTSPRQLFMSYLREAKEVDEYTLYKKFKLSSVDMRKNILDSYGIVTYTKIPNDYGGVVYHYLADDYVDFINGPYKGKLPVNHVRVEA